MQDNEKEEKDDRNVFNLVSQLRKEKLFITNEKRIIQKLNEDIKDTTETLIKSTWITTKQRLYLLDQREVTILNYKHIKAILNATFVEAKSVFKFQSLVKIENLLQILRTQPEQFAAWIFNGELLHDEGINQAKVFQAIVTGLYSSCLFPEDTTYMLKLLYELAKLQLVKSDHPRRILKQGSCSFRNLYFTFNEVLPTAKFFLSAALEIPILRLLTHREIYLDIDGNKTLMRYRNNENNIRAEFRDLQEYRNEVVQKLSEFANYFIRSLRENIYSFPNSIAWIVHKISKIISLSFAAKEANAIVTELIFTLYICPAIVDPEQYSICDSEITEIARHNLIQIGQILQALALTKFETPDAKYNDIYRMFDKDLVANFIEDVLFNLEHEDEPPVDLTPPISRDLALFEEGELQQMIAFLQKIHELKLVNGRLENCAPSLVNGLNGIEDQIASLVLPTSLENSPRTQKPQTNGFSDNSLKKHNFLSFVTQTSESRDLCADRLRVVIFSLDKEMLEPIGLVAEEKVLNRSLAEPSVAVEELINLGEGVEPSYQDEGSIGNQSDNLEVISEAASNHSVASSLELENEDQVDNLSDMISANVSGRGTPNISGRDTPSSQLNDNEPVVEARQAPQVSRQIRSEIDDKFCKFEIKKLLEGDETISIYSETWSTDVLASDNETIDASDSRAERPNLALMEQAISGNVLDISETQSESAWSTDVMASDTERLTEVDNDDASSVAQSTESNSVINEIVDETPSRKLSNGSLNFFEVRKIEIRNERKTTTDNNANNVVFKTGQTSYNRLNSVHQKASIKDLPGPSGLNNNVSSLSKQNKYDGRPNEILLSNCSLNSSSSGSSSNSFENGKQRETCEWENKPWLNGSGSSLNVTSTPSESTSELSVLSVSNLNNPIMKTIGRIKPSASTGAIPKSISFDTSADKGDRSDEDPRNKRTSFFGKIKMGFKNRRGKAFRSHFDIQFDDDITKRLIDETTSKMNNMEVSDDILAKYRGKPFIDNSILKPVLDSKIKMPNADCDESDSINNTFDDIKRKLRIVLSKTTLQAPKVIVEKRLSVKGKIETILRLELGKIRKLKEWSNIARVSEALRFINLLNENTCINLLQAMKADFLKRSFYVEYLIGSRQELLFCKSYLNDLSEQIYNEKEQSEAYLSTICVRQFLNEQESLMNQFDREFNDINLSDEKCDYLNKFYKQLYAIMQCSELWQDIFKHRCDIIKITLERCVISKVYEQAIFPNGDGDRDRDYVLYQHIEKLSGIITPHHKDLMIHKMYLRELPWIPAQDALKAIGAYRTPRDKVKCVVNCAKCIMDLLSFSQHAGSTTADDFTPVLVYVIIKVNPINLLSTIQFVNSFYQHQLSGEEMYWWTQFCSSVEYIKTMDYSD